MGRELSSSAKGPVITMDDGDFDDFDALIEDDANMDMGADDDEMDMMYAMEQEQNAADKDGGVLLLLHLSLIHI